MSGPQISRSVGGLMTCTWPQRWPELLPRSRYQRPPGHGSIFIGTACRRASALPGPARPARPRRRFRSAPRSPSPCGSRENRLTAVPCPFSCSSFPGFGGCRRIDLFTRPALGALLDAVQLLAPELFKGLDPVVHSFQLLRLEAVDTLLAVLEHRHQADLAQHAEVLGDRRLREAQRNDQRSDGQGPAPRQQLDDLPPPGLGDGVEDVGGGWRPRHASIIFP